MRAKIEENIVSKEKYHPLRLFDLMRSRIVALSEHEMVLYAQWISKLSNLGNNGI